MLYSLEDQLIFVQMFSIGAGVQATRVTAQKMVLLHPGQGLDLSRTKSMAQSIVLLLDPKYLLDTARRSSRGNSRSGGR